MSKKPLRLLMVEDDEARVVKVRGWLPEYVEHDGALVPVRLTNVVSAGVALGVVKRALPGDWAAILLDHDLDEQARTPADHDHTGRDVARALIERTPTLGSLRILVHSMNPIAGAMAEELARAGHAVDQRPFARLDEEAFRAWFELVVEEWEAT